MKTATLAALMATTYARSTKVEDFFNGVLNGAVDYKGTVTDIPQCLTDLEKTVQDLMSLKSDISARDWTKIITDATTVVSDINTDMSDCSSSGADFKKLGEINALASKPATMGYIRNENLLINGDDVLPRIQAAGVSMVNGDLFNFGKNIGMALKQVANGRDAEPQIKKAQILQGMLKSFGGHFNLEALLICVDEEDQALLAFDMAVKTIEEAFKNKDWTELIGAVIAVVAGVQQAKQGLSACEAIDTSSMDFIGFEKSIDIMKNPIAHFKVLEDDLQMHEHSILQISAEAAQNYERQEFEQFGEKLGQIMKYSTEKKVEVDTEERHIDEKQIAELFQGLLSATDVGSFNFTDLLICIGNLDKVALMMDEDVKIAEKIIHDTTWKERAEDAVGFAMLLLAGVQQFKQGLPVCKTVIQQGNWSEWDHIESVLYNTNTNMQVIENDIMVNGNAITEDLVDAMFDFRNEEYKKFGYKFGTVLKEATQTEADLFLY